MTSRRLPSWLVGDRLELRRELKRADKREADLRSRLDGLEAALKDVRKNVAQLAHGVHTVLEEEHVRRYRALARSDRTRLPTDHRDPNRALLEVLDCVGAETYTFVDIGSGRSGGKGDCLARRFRWSGVFVDASEATVAALTKRFASLEGVTVLHREVTPENVGEIVARGGERPDLLSIDIDSYDYWVWKALTAQPRVVVIEYNSHLGHEPVAVPYGGIGPDSPKGYSGASLAALAKLGAEKGYVLLGCDYMGVNAFFARRDACEPSLAQSPKEAWRPSLSRVETAEVSRDGEKVRAWIEAAGLPLARV